MIEHTETYQGVRLTVAADHVVYDGRRVRRPTGDTTTVIRKVRGWVRREHADAALRPEVTPLIGVLSETDLDPVEDASVGDVVYVHAMGRWRRGKVISFGRTRVTVAYTTSSSGGRIFRKRVPPRDLRRPHVPASLSADGDKCSGDRLRTKRTVVYARGREFEQVAGQVDACTRYAERRGWRVDQTCFDVGRWSSLDKLREDISAGRVGRVLVASPDRLGSDLANLTSFLDHAAAHATHPVTTSGVTLTGQSSRHPASTDAHRSNGRG